METAKIREDLKDIRYYYSRKAMFEKASASVGENNIATKLEKYNEVVRSAPPRLYDLYISLYLDNNTQESLSDKLGYSVEYISKLNGQLIRFFQKNIKEEIKWKYQNF